MCSSAEMRKAFFRIDKDFDRGSGVRLDPNNFDTRGGCLILECSPALLAHLCGAVNQALVSSLADRTSRTTAGRPRRERTIRVLDDITDDWDTHRGAERSARSSS